MATFPGSAGATGRPAKDPDAAPENPYPVVTSFNPTASTCEWCQAICVKEKIYIKAAAAGQWRGKCGDCGKSERFTTKEMIDFGRFTVAKED